MAQTISTSPAASDPTFTTHPTLTPRFDVPIPAYLAAHPTITYKSTAFTNIAHIAVGAIVISPPATTQTTATTSTTATQPPPKALLLRRAASDSMPNRWEVPGGAVDAEDATLLHGAARELLEESGLRAVRIGPLVRAGAGSASGTDDAQQQQQQQQQGDDGQVFSTRSGNLVAKFHFLVEVAPGCENDVRCDPSEHSEWVWATEAEVQESVVGGREVRFTTAEQKEALLEGFRSWRGLREGVV